MWAGYHTWEGDFVFTTSTLARVIRRHGVQSLIPRRRKIFLSAKCGSWVKMMAIGCNGLSGDVLALRSYSLDNSKRSHLVDILRGAGFEASVLSDDGRLAASRVESEGQETVLQIGPGYADEPCRFMVDVIQVCRVAHPIRSRRFFRAIESALIGAGGRLDD